LDATGQLYIFPEKLVKFFWKKYLPEFLKNNKMNHGGKNPAKLLVYFWKNFQKI